MTNLEKDLSKLLAKYDLEGLIKMGAPDDEYDSEAFLIYQSVSKNMGWQEIAEVVKEIFDEWIMPIHPKNVDEYKDVAKDILNLLNHA